MKWSIIKKMDKPLKGLQAISLLDGIYIIGGHDGEKETNQIQK